ncbi:hypothetical protein PAPYR_7704 [Paratrimastix pyriformis]|uniref:Uncharacterized protein n=1 Tax=Paratrimastix pyriformis TaxID=342808 RepID=A0ABQ8UEN4_9EUKA|nr:hypothetical protein PAPYR_7704 [Paratrimastix pyriformis]
MSSGGRWNEQRGRGCDDYSRDRDHGDSGRSESSPQQSRGGYENRFPGGYRDRGGYDDRRGGYDDRRGDDRRGGYDDRRGGYDDRRGGPDSYRRDDRGGNWHDRRPPMDDRRGGRAPPRGELPSRFPPPSPDCDIARSFVFPTNPGRVQPDHLPDMIFGSTPPGTIDPEMQKAKDDLNATKCELDRIDLGFVPPPPPSPPSHHHPPECETPTWSPCVDRIDLLFVPPHPHCAGIPGI